MEKEDSGIIGFMAAKKGEYTGRDITVLEGIEPVRRRPAMYIGSTDLSGLHHLITEIVDNSVDEALAGFAKNIWVFLNSDGSATVIDDGRGIPVDEVEGYKQSALELVMTRLHAGGKFGQKAYSVSSGLHGVGASVVNALSEYLMVTVYREGKVFEQKYERGKPISPVGQIPRQKPARLSGSNKFQTGTVVTFKPDSKIFPEIRFDYATIRHSLKHRAYLVAGIAFHLYDERNSAAAALEREDHFYFDGGIVSLVKSLNVNKESLHPVVKLEGREGNIEVEVALQYVDGFQEITESFVNVVNTTEGGSHLTGFKTALTRAINDYARAENLIKENEENLTGNDVREGLTTVVYVKMPGDRVQFQGQTKTKLGNAEVGPIVQNITLRGLQTFLEENPKEAVAIVSKVALAAKARQAAKAAKEAVIRKGALEGGSLPGKLADCQTKNPTEAELFVVEGDSAGGSAKQGRDRACQAILPLWGKILNTERYRLDKIVNNDKFKPLILALGAGIGEYFDINKLRYHKIIIMADADVDGRHIETLYLTLFFRHLKEIVEKGHLYVASPPLYKASAGKNRQYLFTDEERMEFEQKKGGAKVNIQRFKGLGEMNADELWETTMNPETRILKKVMIEDAVEADKTFIILMGKKVLPRKHFIQARAKMAAIDA